ncbi:IS1 family transposase [Tunicatimonas pelagia]|uniref:IS1 family transposase n=1 Tax=Tunicatimonas pelagia TaxID=931531 RepID=UPI00266665F3|nr:IS1 family transposase [Tunicatimonas pelagia]WKN42110.1 IS1 family transposase [Tunicatimonas pelagia]WKN45084.1 IS1 family transposase [Tunicatimonas pelagia]
MTTCPHCQSLKIVKNGFTSYGKQNYRCRVCKRQAVERMPATTFEREELLKKLLLERVSLRAIARILRVSLHWVVQRAKQCWQSVSTELPIGKLDTPELHLYCLEADEMWTFVGAKDCPEWLWLAVERRTGLVVGFHLGGRDQEGALGLWLSISKKLRKKALVFTDGLAAYANVFERGQHQPEGKPQTIKIERLNNTIRQRCARLVRKTLSFSKVWENHYLAIKYFLVDYNLSRLAKKPSLF